MFKLRKSFRFEAAHKLPNHDGKCRRLHGHSWVGTLVLEDYELHTTGPKQGMVHDFSDLSTVVEPLVEQYLDHHYLNETLGLTNPTSEEIARWVFDKLKYDLPALVAVQIDETCTCSCEYRPSTLERVGT